ncbi:hypothetical protein VNO77_02057 [Canavalia gladiata]|uniref:Uncharacterized protein n=1 Tax=Canavalia gladiata TaxID=3824 RepID=A0AAN9MXJ5_CANGL
MANRILRGSFLLFPKICDKIVSLMPPTWEQKPDICAWKFENNEARFLHRLTLDDRGTEATIHALRDCSKSDSLTAINLIIKRCAVTDSSLSISGGESSSDCGSVRNNNVETNRQEDNMLDDAFAK